MDAIPLAGDSGDAVRGFHHFNAAWYAYGARTAGLIDRVGIGIYCRGGGTLGEFAIEWRGLGGSPTPQLQVFNDAWHVLPQFADVLAGLAEIGRHPTGEDVCALLLACGLEELTAREQRE